MHYFEVPSFQKKFCHKCIQSNLLDPKRCSGLFRSISQPFGTKNNSKLVFLDWMHYYEVPSFRKKFCHKCIQSNLLDPKRCSGLFRCISQPFGMKNHAKLVFRGWMHYFEVPSSWNFFAANASSLTCSTKNDVWECFGAFHKPSAQIIMKNLCFGAECTNSGYWTFRKSFATNATNLTC